MQLLGEEEQLLTRFLLGELPAEEAKRFEERCCLDGELFERMLAHGNDLIDHYLVGRLSASQRRGFERHFLNLPGQRERFQTARALQDVFAAEREEKPEIVRLQPERASWWRKLLDSWRGQPLAFAAVAVAILLLLTGLLAIFDSLRLRGELNQARAEREAAEQRFQQEIVRERERADQLEAELRLAQGPRETPSPNLQSSPLPPSDLIASVNLASDYIGGDRGPGRTGGKLIVPAGAGRVQLRLQLRNDDYRSYRVTIRASSSDRPIWRQAALQAQSVGDGKAVIVTLPASRLIAARDYLVTLDGQMAAGNYEEEADQYSFRVEKR